jgi:hypothetical protein
MKQVDDDEKAVVVAAAEMIKDLVFEILPTAVLYRSQKRSSGASSYAFAES